MAAPILAQPAQRLSDIDDLFSAPSPAIGIPASKENQPVAPGAIPAAGPAPGIYYDIPASEYHQWEAISSTLLKKYAANPSTARTPYVPGDDANVGSGIHAYSLQGHEGLNAECFFLPESCGGKSAKAIAEREMYAASNPGKALLPAYYGSPAPGLPIMKVLEGVDESLFAHPKISTVMENSRKEVSLVWIDPGSGMKCKARLDIWDGSIIWDLKKVRKIGGLKWEMDSGLMYRIQAAHYLNGAEACGLKPVAFGFIACEAFPPFEVRPFYSDPDKTELAQFEVKRLIGLVKQSMENDYWPNFPPPPGLMNWSDLEPDSTIELL